MKLLLKKLISSISRMINTKFKKKSNTSPSKNTWESNSSQDWDQYGDYIDF